MTVEIPKERKVNLTVGDITITPDDLDRELWAWLIKRKEGETHAYARVLIALGPETPTLDIVDEDVVTLVTQDGLTTLFTGEIEKIHEASSTPGAGAQVRLFCKGTVTDAPTPTPDLNFIDYDKTLWMNKARVEMVRDRNEVGDPVLYGHLVAMPIDVGHLLHYSPGATIDVRHEQVSGGGDMEVRRVEMVKRRNRRPYIVLSVTQGATDIISHPDQVMGL